MGIYDKYKKLILPLTSVKTQVTTALPGVIGRTVTTGLGNEGIDLAIWINEKLQDNTIEIPGLAELIQLTGMPEGSTTLGSFNGNIIPDNSTIKQALQILETAVMGAGGGSGLNGIYTGSGDIASNVVANVTDSFSINTGASDFVKIGDINGVLSNDFNSINGIGLEINSQGYVKLGKVFSQTGYAPSLYISKEELSLVHDYNNHLTFTSTEFPVLKTDKTQFNIWGAYNNFKGLVYKADYSNNYVDRSLVDKAYVDLKSQIVADGDKGDITISNNGTVWLVNNSVLTYNKLQNTTGSKLLGRYDSTTGTIQEIALGTGLAFVNNTLVSTGGSGGILLTTNNSSGPATLNSGILNIPNYSLTGLGGVPTTRTITINGETYDLSQNRSWNITSMIYPSAGIPISTGTGWGTSITNNSTNWNTAYSWGNHALAGYLTSYTETDPTVPSHVKAITTTNISNWNSAYGWGNHATQGYLTSVNLNALTDVTIGTLNNGQILQYNGTTSQWENVSVTIGSGDMQKSVYDIDNDGVVDYSETISVTVRNNSSTDTLRRGTIVYLSGSTGNRPNAFKAQANSESTSSGTFGVVVNDIGTNGDGLVAAMGTLHNLDTRTGANGNPNPFTSDTLVDGDILWLDPTTAGYVTKTKPSAPNHAVFIGIVAATSPTNGRIVYKIQNGYEIEELHNVKITSPLSNNQVLRYNDSNSLWENKTLNFQVPLTLTTNGTSGAATLTGDGVLNIPNYSTAPGGSNTEVQFNNSGVFGGSSKFTWDGTNLKLSDVTVASPSIAFNSTDSGSSVVNQSTVYINNITTNNSSAEYQSSLVFNSYNNANGYGSTPLTIYTVYANSSNTFLRNEIFIDGSLSISNVPTTVSTAANLIGITTSDGLFKTSLDSSTLSLSSAGVLSGVIKTLNDLTDVVVSSPTSGQVLSYNGTNWVNTTGGGGGGTPGGSTTEVQFNDAGSFGGAAGFTYDKTAFTNTGRLNIGSPSSPTGRLNVKGGGNDSTTVNTRLTDSGNTELLKVLDNGNTNIGTGFNWDNANGRLGIGTSTPGTSIETTGAIRLSGTGTQPLEAPNATLFPVRCISGSIALRSSSGGGVSVSSSDLTPSARLHVVGSGTSNTTTALLVQNNATTPVDLFKIADNGTMSLKRSINAAGFYIDNGGEYMRGGASGNFSIGLVAAAFRGYFQINQNHENPNGDSWYFGYSTPASFSNISTTGTNTFIGVQGQFRPTSGTAIYSQLTLYPTINQTGGASGTTRGLYVNPTLTSAFDWRSIEWSNNTGYGLYGAGTANNYLAGNTAIGTTTPSARLHVRGSDDLSTSSAFLVQNNATTPLTLLDIRNNGDFSLGANFVFDRANNRLNIGNPTSPAATVNIKGAGNSLASGNAMNVTNSDSKSIIRTRNDGVVLFGNTSAIQWFPIADAGGGANTIDGTNFSLFSGNTTQAASWGRLHIGGEVHTQTSGDVVHMYLFDRFSPTSGAATTSTLRVNTQINQTGGANGITRGIYLTPMLTSAADWRSIEWSNNSGFGLYGVGTANNYLAGNLGLGTTAPTKTLHVAGVTRMDGTIAIADNRDNAFLTQSASTTTSNRESVWGNGGYAKLRAHTKGFYVGASFPAADYLLYVDGGTGGGALDRAGIYLRPTQPEAGGNTNGGDVIIELPAGTGTGRRGEVLIGTATATGPSAIVEISSTNQGLLLPRMTGAQAEAIPTPADGLLVYANNGNGAVITSVGFWGYSAGAWSKLN